MIKENPFWIKFSWYIWCKYRSDSKNQI